MQLYLTVRPEELRETASLSQGLAHAAYRIGHDSTLLSRDLLAQCSPRGHKPPSLLVLTDRNAPPLPDPEALAASVVRECLRRDYAGALLDFEAPPRQDLRDLAAALGCCCAKARRALYLPDVYVGVAPQAAVIVSTAISGGQLEAYLRETAERLGSPRRLALDCQRLRMSFSLPDPTGQGQTLEQAELDALLKEQCPAVFFSRDLCARYFTCTVEGCPRFVLFDDADTLRQKLRLGQTLGVSAAFFQWPEIRDIAGSLLRA